MNDEDKEFIFNEGPAEEPDIQKQEPWKIMLVEDEKAVHETTMRVLEDFSFEDRRLSFLNAYSAEQAKDMIREHPDIAVIFLDVVMETDHAGLELVRYIREELKNSFVRIVLRTGQPGKAPERKVIIEYDINDYKAKTELTAQKLFTAVISSLRSYRDLRIIEKNRRGLQQIIDSSAQLFEIQSLRNFAGGMLTQLLAILHMNESSLYLQQSSSFTASGNENDFIVHAGTGDFEECVGKPVKGVLPDDVYQFLMKAVKEEKSFFDDDKYVGYFSAGSGAKYLLYLTGCKDLSEMDKDFIRIFSVNVAIAFENICLNREIRDTRKELIYTLTEEMVNRSDETSGHIRRVSEFSYLLALKAGLTEEKGEVLRLAIPMHDIGKTDFPSSIMLNPDKSGEFESLNMQKGVGSRILKDSVREIWESAAIIASQHHERWDGCGYPRRLKGEEIHIYARITALADVFDALLLSCTSKGICDLNKILKAVEDEKGKHFDPELVDILMENINEFYVVSGQMEYA
ncbi:MAG: DUF3369 domain-containing protein [Desulfobacterales bacterium]|nr:DUF3369 domain-containing protein [Desulfobacterales bacterium]